MGTLQRASSHCSTLPYQSSYGLYPDPYRVSQQGLVELAYPDRTATRSPSIDSIHKDPRYTHTHTPHVNKLLNRKGSLLLSISSHTPISISLFLSLSPYLSYLSPLSFCLSSSPPSLQGVCVA